MSEPSHPTLTLILSIWAGLGPLVGLLTGTFLQSRIARKQWVRDKRQEEFRELLDALADALTTLLSLHQHMVPQTPEDRQKIEETNGKVFRVVNSRIFTARVIERLNAGVKWNDATRKYERDFDVPSLIAVYDEVNRGIVDAAIGKDAEGMARKHLKAGL